MRLAAPIVRLSAALRRAVRRLRRGEAQVGAEPSKANSNGVDRAGAPKDRAESERLLGQPGTYTFRHDYRWFRQRLADLPGFEIRVWRSVSVEFLRAIVHPKLLGRKLLQGLTWLEERLPHWLGRHGQYPMIVFSKPAASPFAGEGSG
jgi:hypothetical protein